MSLYEEYHESTGLHAFYKRQVAGIQNKQELVFTRKYTWWCEEKIGKLQKQIQEIKEGEKNVKSEIQEDKSKGKLFGRKTNRK